MNFDKEYENLIRQFEDEINNLEFDNVSLAMLNSFGKSAVDKLTDVFKKFSNYTFPWNNYFVEGSTVYSKDKKTLIKYDCKNYDESFTVPDFVETIGYNAFKNNANIKTVEIHDHVKMIDNNAFQNCDNLEEIFFGKVEKAGHYVFDNCKNLKKVNMDTPSNIFYYACDGKQSSPFCNGAKLYANGKEVDSIVVPDDAKSLDGLYGCTSIKNINFNADNKFISKKLLDHIK